MASMNIQTEGSVQGLQHSILVVQTNSMAGNQVNSHDSSSKVSEIMQGLSNASSSGISSQAQIPSLNQI